MFVWPQCMSPLTTFRPCRVAGRLHGLVGAILLCCSVTALGGSTIYVRHDAIGANDGTSWTDAFLSLQDATAKSRSGDEIWVAGGTYKPTQPWAADDPRAVSFQLKTGVGIYGGVAGTETTRDARDWGNHPTAPGARRRPVKQGHTLGTAGKRFIHTEMPGENADVRCGTLPRECLI